MNYEEINLHHLFQKNQLQGKEVSEIERDKKITSLKNELLKKEPQLKWKNVWEEIIETSTQLLNLKLSVVLEKAWEKYEEVSKYLDVNTYGKDEVFLIPLLEHTITSEHHPKIEVSLGETQLGEINFDLLLNLKLSGILLKINGGKIQGVKSGKCSSSGSFSCEGIVLFQDESSEFIF